MLHSSPEMVLISPLLLLSLLFIVFNTCDASPATSINTKFNSERSYTPHASQIGRPPTGLSISKRRVPVRPQGSRPFSAAPPVNNTVRFFNFEYVFTDEEHENLMNLLVKGYEHLIAFMLVGVDIEQRAIAFRIGAYTLNVYAIVEALSQSIVLAVFRRLAQLIQMKLGFFLGEGIVVVGAGVRVLVAAGIRLQGVEDINEVMVRPLVRLIG